MWAESPSSVLSNADLHTGIRPFVVFHQGELPLGEVLMPSTSTGRRTIPLGRSSCASEITKVPELSLLLHTHLYLAVLPWCRSMALWSRYHRHRSTIHRRVSCLAIILECHVRYGVCISGEHYLGQAYEYPGDHGSRTSYRSECF